MQRNNQIIVSRILLFLMSICVTLVSSVGCVPVKFLDTTDVKWWRGPKKIGFEYFAPKTYLVVETTKDGKKARLLTMPDVTKPRQVEYQPIWGSAEVGFKVENGVITEFNAKHDPKGPETVTALAGAAAPFLATAAASEKSPVRIQ